MGTIALSLFIQWLCSLWNREHTVQLNL